VKRCLWQVVGRFERQLKQTVHQLQSEQQRAANTCLEKDRQVRSVDVVTQMTVVVLLCLQQLYTK